MTTLLYLESRKVVNYARMTLRSPKRLIPAIFIGIWLMMTVGPYIMLRAIGPFGPRRSSAILVSLPPHIPVLVFALISMVMVYGVYKSFSDSFVVFRLSDIDFLFPTPISKRAIMGIRLAGLYAKVGIYAAFIAFVVGGQMMMVIQTLVNPVVALLSLMLFAVFMINICTTINLVATFREGRKWWLAYLVRGAAYLLVIFIMGRWALGYMQTQDISQSAIQAFNHPLVVTLLLPARWATDLVLSSFTGWTPALGGEFAMMWVLALGSLALVLSRNENPYEPSLMVSARAAAIRSAIRSGGWGKYRTEMRKQRLQKGGKAKTGVPPFGRGVLALVWKNLNIGMRTSGKAMIAIPILLAVILGALRIAAPDEIGPKEVHGFATFLIAYLLFISSTIMLHNFRADLKQANILRPMPIPAWQVIAAEGVHGTLMITAVAWIALILVAVSYGLEARSPLVMAVLALPFAAYGSLCWQAVAAVIYPNPDDPTQQFVGNMLSGFAGFISIGPAIGIGALGWFLHLGVVIPAMMIAVFSTGMAVGGILLSAWLYKRFDPTEE